MILWVVLALQGQVAKFDDRQPTAEYVTSATMEDVERCLIKSLAPPQVYRQPDRPGDVMIVWPGVSLSSGAAAGRVDLSRRQNGTNIRAWMSEKIVNACAPRKL